MAGYVDGFVMPLPKANVDKYREIATTAGGLWIEQGRSTTRSAWPRCEQRRLLFRGASSSRMTRR